MTVRPDAVGVDVIRRYTLALAKVAAAAPLTTPVASCGDWSLGDLVWHLTEVQAFWAHVIGNRPEGPETYDRPVRVADGQLQSELVRVCDQLSAALDGLAPTDSAWSWSSDHTVGFTLRRQSHEAFVHAIDGLLACGAELPGVAPELPGDGIDEVVTIMLVESGADQSFTSRGQTVCLRATDVDEVQTIELGSIELAEGGGPAPAAQLSDAASADCTVEGPALALLLWLWGRADLSELDVSGGPGRNDLAADVRALLIHTTQ